MKSLPRPLSVGNVKLRGKRQKGLSCGCCVAQNFKWSERVKEAIREIRQGGQS